MCDLPFDAKGYTRIGEGIDNPFPQRFNALG
jgi:hypothetical protein